MAWPIASPAIDHQRAIYLGSTAPNTSTCQKYMTVGSSDGFSDIKGVHMRIDSPYAIRRFMDSEHAVSGATNKIHEKSEFKSYFPISNSNWNNM